MLKNKLNYKLINLALIVLIVFFIYQTGNLWIGILSKFLKIIIPFIFAFAIAYSLYPFLTKMEEKKFPKWLGVTIIVFGVLALITLVIYLITTIFVSELSGLFNNILDFISSIQKNKLDFNLSGLEDTLSNSFENILSNLGNYVSNGAINIVNTSLSLLSNLLIIFASFIYFLIDMDKIREGIKRLLKRKSNKIFNYVKTLDDGMKNYLNGLVQVMIITIIEYTLAYTIIGHPSAIILGFLAMIGNLIPYFGGIGVNVIASITAFVVSPSLLIRTIITFAILSAIDGYVINPTIYGKTNSIHPLITIIALFAGGIIFGIMGVFISFPLTIIIISTYKYFKEDIKTNIKKVKNS